MPEYQAHGQDGPLDISGRKGPRIVLGKRWGAWRREEELTEMLEQEQKAKGEEGELDIGRPAAGQGAAFSSFSHQDPASHIDT